MEGLQSTQCDIVVRQKLKTPAAVVGWCRWTESDVDNNMVKMELNIFAYFKNTDWI